MHKRVLTTLALASLIALAACGSDDKEGSSTQATTPATEATTPPTDAPGGTDVPGTTGEPTTTAAQLDLPAEIHIGVPLDMSGSAAVASVGVDELDGIKLAVDEINSSGYLGDSKIVLDVVDTQADKQKSVEATLKFVSDEVTAVVGFTITPSWLAAAPALQEAGIPAMAVELSAKGVTEVGDKMFRLYPDMGKVIPGGDVDFATAFGSTKVAYLYQSDAASTAEIHAARKAALEAAGFETVEEQTFAGTDTDVRAQLTAIQDSGADLVVVTPLPGLMTIVYLQAAEIGLDAQIIGSPDANQAILEQAGPEMQCLVYTTAWNRKSTEGANTHFLELWAEKGTGKDPDVFHAAGYSAMWAMATGIHDANSVEGADIAAAIVAIDSLPTTFGDVDFKDNRAAKVLGTKVQILDSQVELWDESSTCSK